MTKKDLDRLTDETMEYMSGYDLSDEEFELVETALLHLKYELTKEL